MGSNQCFLHVCLIYSTHKIKFKISDLRQFAGHSFGRRRTNINQLLYSIGTILSTIITITYRNNNCKETQVDFQSKIIGNKNKIFIRTIIIRHVPSSVSLITLYQLHLNKGRPTCKGLLYVVHKINAIFIYNSCIKCALRLLTKKTRELRNLLNIIFSNLWFGLRMPTFTRWHLCKLYIL